jgi:tetratricopeptide (TPR) repeat protein
MMAAAEIQSDEERIAHAKEQVRRQPEDPEARRRLAGMLYLAGRLEEAIPHLEKAAALSGGAVEYELALADVLFDALQPGRAAELYEKLLSKVEGPRRGRVELNLDLARSEVAFYDAIGEPLSKAAAGSPERSLLEGTLCLMQGRTSEALCSFEKAMSSPATARAAQENIAFVWSVSKELPPDGERRLVSHLLEARKGGAPSTRFLLYLAEAYSISHIHEKARELLVTAIKGDPKYLPAYDQACAFLRQLTIHGEGMADAFRRAVNGVIDRLPERIMVFARRRFSGIKARQEHGDADRAVKELLTSSDDRERLMGMLEAAEQFSPSEAIGLLGDRVPVEDPVARLVLARLRLRTHGLKRAIGTVLEGLSAYPANAEVAYAAGYFLGLRRRLATARAMVGAAGGREKIKPELLLEAGLVLVEAGEFDEAVKLAADSVSPEAVVVRARARIRSGHEDEALGELERAWDETSSDIVRRELAALYFRLGRDGDAVELLTK